MQGKRFAAIVMTDVALMMALILWVLFANTTAEVVFKAYFWAIVPLSIVAYVVAPARLRDLARSAWWFVGYSRGVRLVSGVFLAMAQETAMLAVLIVAWLVFEAAYSACIEREKEDETTA